MKLSFQTVVLRDFTMPKKYYLAADGGGSKLQAILYDDDLRVIRAAKTTGVNTIYKPFEAVRENINRLVDELLLGDGTHEPITEIDAADLCLVSEDPKRIIEDALRKKASVKQTHYYHEPDIGAAASFQRDCVIALSGTGSDAFFVRDGRVVSSVGGWGPLLGDEGSGYDIGLNTLKAAIYSHDGRRQKTVLYDMVMKKWGLTRLSDMIYRLANNPDTRHEVASVAILCSEAAKAGDEVAVKIYEHAAVELFRLTRAIIEKYREEWNGNVIIMGGAWKGYEGMFEHYRQMLTAKYPEIKLGKPLFEPVVGCAVLRCWRDGLSTEEIREPFIEGFKAFLYK